MPELSIIVPVYKVENYLHKCIDSILAQTFTDFELILIDDGSPDRCGEICDEYAAKDERIVVIHQENKGVSAARNAGLDIAKGEYIGFVDSDDWIESEMYETMIGLAKAKSIDVVMCGASHWSEESEFLYHDLRREKEFSSSEELVVGLYGTPNIISGALWNKLFSHKCISGSHFDPSLKMSEDWLFLADVLYRAERGIKIAAPLYNYLERNNSLSRSNNIDLVFDNLFRARYMVYRCGLRYTRKIAQAASNKFLDDCLRYSPELKSIGKENGLHYGGKLLRIKWRMLGVISRAIITRTLSPQSIHGYLIQTILL